MSKAVEFNSDTVSNTAMVFIRKEDNSVMPILTGTNIRSQIYEVTVFFILYEFVHSHLFSIKDSFKFLLLQVYKSIFSINDEATFLLKQLMVVIVIDL